MTQYRYLFADLITNQILGELPLTGVSFTQQLNQAGALQGHLLLSGINAAGLNVDASTTPGRVALYVDRNDILVWGGIIWGRDYNSASQTLSIQAREFESYFERRKITSTVAYTNTDQLTIAQNIVRNAQSVPYGDIGITVGSETSGVLISRTYYGYELKQVYSALQDLSRSQTGFDFNITVAYDGDANPTKTFKIGYPRLGTAYSATNPSIPMFEMPGNVVEYSYPEDGSIAANTIYALGAGSNEGKLIMTATDSTKTSSGWALLEDDANYSDITDSVYLGNLATGQVNSVSYPPTVIKVVVPAYQSPEFGTYVIGDDARLRITDNRFPNTLDAVYRIVGFNVQPGEDGPERVTITLTNTTS
jgi:hypothetical protein